MILSIYVVSFAISAVLILAACQFYLWHRRRVPIDLPKLRSPLDDRVSRVPSWVWKYSLLYYPAILYMNALLRTAEQFTRVAFGYLVLLALHASLLQVFAARPAYRWRPAAAGVGHAERLLALVRFYDVRSSSFPSMQTSVATLTALHLYGHGGALALALPLPIGVSRLSKQHYVMDVPAGAALGWAVYRLFPGSLAGY